MAQFMDKVNAGYQQDFSDYPVLHAWSIEHKSDFWKAVWDFCDIKASCPPTSIFEPGESMRDATWFEGAKLNFAENLLKRCDDHIAIRYAREDGMRQTLTYKQLNEAVYGLAAYLESIGVTAHDRVAGFMTNCPQTVIAMLATTLIGAVWTSCSPDFGLDGVLDRFGQIQPKVLFAAESHNYNGKVFDHSDLIKKVKEQIDSIKEVIICTPDKPLPKDSATVFPTQLGFNHPTFILYSSGTTGQPKCMVHGAGGTLIQHLKELQLHSNLTNKDTLFFYTTCGWMMWNWLVSGLAVGATIVLYDGSPFTKNKAILYDLIDEMNITHFGVGAKYFESSSKFNLAPISSHKLNSLSCVLTTGSPLLPNSFDYIYSQIKNDVRVSSISGGSDIISCFALGNPIMPVYCGELQCIGLGMDVHVFNDDGTDIIDEKGELVCTSAFPSRPIYFWNDASGEKYQHAYYDQFPGIWTHGDYAMMTSHHGLIIYGRSDATLNPRGVRIGTAEIYRQVEKFADVVESVAVGKEQDGSEIIILFVVMQPGLALTDDHINMIKKQIKDNTSPLHVPSKIIQVPDLPRTISGKTVELAVKNLINGQPIRNKSALANPDILNMIQQIINDH
jgi:acetoacetyl-CoA synthetase